MVVHKRRCGASCDIQTIDQETTGEPHFGLKAPIVPSVSRSTVGKLLVMR